MMLRARSLRVLTGLIALPIAYCLLPVAFVFASDWPNFQGGPLRKGVSDETFRIPSRVGWVLDAREGLPPAYKPVEFPVPVVADERLYIGTSLKTFYCLSARDGAVIWKFNAASSIESTAAVYGYYVYFGDNGGNLYALDRRSGNLLWRYETKGEILSSPLAVGGIVYATNSSMEVFALDALTGKRLWNYKRPTSRGISIRGSSSPSYDGTRVYVGFSDGFVVALNPYDGTMIWEMRLAEARRQFKDVDASPVPDGDSLYVSFYDGSLYSLKTADGSVNWKYDEGGAGSLAVTGKGIYIPSSRGAVYSIDKRTGKQVWAHKIEKGVPSSIISVDGYLIFGLSGNGVAAVDIDKGEEKWKYTPGSGIYGGLAYSGGNLFFLSNGGFIYSVPCR